MPTAEATATTPATATADIALATELPDPTDNPFLDQLDALLQASVGQSVAVLGKQIEMGIVTAGVTALSGLAGAFRDIVTTVGRNIRA